MNTDLFFKSLCYFMLYAQLSWGGICEWGSLSLPLRSKLVLKADQDKSRFWNGLSRDLGVPAQEGRGALHSRGGSAQPDPHHEGRCTLGTPPEVGGLRHQAEEGLTRSEVRRYLLLRGADFFGRRVSSL